MLIGVNNSSLGGLNFAQDAEGNWGYIPSGADTVIPFKSGNFTISFKINLKDNNYIPYEGGYRLDASNSGICTISYNNGNLSITGNSVSCSNGDYLSANVNITNLSVSI